MKDNTISKQEAIEALERIFDRCEEIEADFPDGDPDKTGYKMLPDYMTVWKYLYQLPPTERHGRWIIEDKYTDYRTERCSACGFAANRAYVQDIWRYCPNCGAKMDEGYLSNTYQNLSGGKE